MAHTAPPGARRLSFGNLAAQRLPFLEEGGADCSSIAQPGSSGEEVFVAVPSSLEAILSLDPLAGLTDCMRRQSRDGTLPVSLGSLQVQSACKRIV